MTVGIAMINRGYWEIGQKFQIEISGKKVSGEVCNLPFL
jgi:glycine cleavage system aminomethyltransferase T